jgi:hypothetical protein
MGNLFSDILGGIGKAAVNTLNTLSGVVTNPWTTITQGLDASTKKFTEETNPWVNVAKTVATTGIAAGAIIGAGAAAAAGVAGTTSAVLKAVAGSPKKIAATALVSGLVASSPTVTKSIINVLAPERLIEAGAGVGNYIEGKDTILGVETSKIVDIGTKIGLIGAGAGLVAAGAIAVPKVIAALTPSSNEGGLLSESGTNANMTPKSIQPQTTTLDKIPSTTGVKRKSKTKNKLTAMSQIVRVNVQNKNNNYIKGGCHR